MKLKLLLTAAVIGAATLSANAGIHFGFSIGLPVPVVVAAPVYAAPVYAPVPVVAAPVYAPVYASTVCPGPGYIWAPGYWSVSTCGRAWNPGCWRYGGYGRCGYGYGYGHGGWGGGWGHGGWGRGGGWHR